MKINEINKINSKNLHKLILLSVCLFVCLLIKEDVPFFFEVTHSKVVKVYLHYLSGVKGLSKP